METREFLDPIGHLPSDPTPTASFQVSRFSEFVFEPFAATLLYLPESPTPSPRSTEYFLAREEEVSAKPGAEPTLVWSREPATEIREDAKKRRASRNDTAENEEPRFYNPKPIRFFDPIAAAEEQDGSSAGTENSKGRPSIQLSPELKAAILAIDAELRRKKNSPGDLETKKMEVVNPPKEKFTTLNLTGIVALPDIPVEIPIQPEPVAAAETHLDSPPNDLPAESEFEEYIEECLDTDLDASEPIAMEPVPIDPESMTSGSIMDELDTASIAATAEAEAYSHLYADLNHVAAAQPLIQDAVPIQPRVPLAERLARWIKGEASLTGNRRKGGRVIVPGLVAFYWSGGNPRPHEVANISGSGFYLRTTEVWLPETLVRMVLQRPHSSDIGVRESLVVLARVVRVDGDGVGHEFVTSEALQKLRAFDILPQQGTDTKQLKKFLAI